MAAVTSADSQQRWSHLFSVTKPSPAVQNKTRESIVKWLSKKEGKPHRNLRESLEDFLEGMDIIGLPSLLPQLYIEYNIPEDSSSANYVLPDPLPEGDFGGKC